MIYPCYVYFDKVAGEYSAPVIEVNAATAQRSFNCKCKANPCIGEDLELHYIGDFDSAKGSFISILEKPSFVARAEVRSNE